VWDQRQPVAGRGRIPALRTEKCGFRQKAGVDRSVGVHSEPPGRIVRADDDPFWEPPAGGGGQDAQDVAGLGIMRR
jgi:hypothetical protein